MPSQGAVWPVRDFVSSPIAALFNPVVFCTLIVEMSPKSRLMRFGKLRSTLAIFEILTLWKINAVIARSNEHGYR
jgi:hypothetical protein